MLFQRAPAPLEEWRGAGQPRGLAAGLTRPRRARPGRRQAVELLRLARSVLDSSPPGPGPGPLSARALRLLGIGAAAAAAAAESESPCCGANVNAEDGGPLDDPPSSPAATGAVDRPPANGGARRAAAPGVSVGGEAGAAWRAARARVLAALCGGALLVFGPGSGEAVAAARDLALAAPAGNEFEPADDLEIQARRGMEGEVGGCG